METAVPGVSVLSLCVKGDAYIMAETGKVFKKEKEMKKGEPKMILVRLLSFGCTELDHQEVLQIVDQSVTPSILVQLFAKLVDDFQMKTWWFSFPSSRHCLSHQRLS